MGELRPPWAPGNTASLKHGATSKRMVAPLAEAAASELIASAPWCAAPAFSSTVRRWAWAFARAELLRHYIDEQGILNEDHEPQPALAELARAEATEAKAAAELGLSPGAFARLLALSKTAEAAGAVGASDQVEALAAVGRELVGRASLPAGEEASDGEE